MISTTIAPETQIPPSALVAATNGRPKAITPDLASPGKPARSIRKWLALAGIVGSAIAAWALLRNGNNIEYRTARVERGDIEAAVTATGSPNAVVTVQVGSQVSGNISALYADFNTPVKKDQLVARIDPQLFEAQVKQASATLEAAKAAVVNATAGVAKAQADVASAAAGVANSQANVLKAQVSVRDGKVKYDRRVPLANEGVISPEDLDTALDTYNAAVADQKAAEASQQAAEENLNAAKAGLEVARTQLASAEAQQKQAQATLDQAQLNLDHTYIRAPVDGVVVSRNVDIGQTVAASLQAPTLFLVAQDLTMMQVDTNVSEADVGRVRLDQPATFTVDAYPGEVFHGTVWQIRQAAINVQNVITYDVVISVSNKDLKLFPGMTANVRILVDKATGALKVPNAALRFQPTDAVRTPDTHPSLGGRKSASTPTVWVLDKNTKIRPVHIETGLTDGTCTEVRAGDLPQGADVVIAAFPKTSSGTTTAPTVSPASSGGSARF